MTKKEFNLKYEKYIEPIFNGLMVDDEQIIKYLDELFEFVIIPINPNFQFSQIKMKYSMIRFYSNLPVKTNLFIERKLQEYVNKK